VYAMTTIIIIGISIAVFTCLIFLSKQPLIINNTIIAVFMLFLVIPMLEKLVLMNVITIPYFQFSIFYGSVLTFGPFLYVYARSEINPDTPFAGTSMLHFIPFALSVFLFLLVGLDFPVQNTPGGGVDIHSFIRIPPGVDMRDVFDTVCLLSLVTYTVLIFALLRRHRRNISDYFSYDSIAINLKWLNWITVCFFISYVFAVVSPQLLWDLLRIPQLDPGIKRDIGTSFFIFVFSFCAIKQPVIFKKRPGQPTVSGSPDPEDSKEKKYSKSGLKDGDAQNFLTILEEYMRSEKPYLDPDITIVDVASTLNIPKHYITQIINEKMNKNFYQYINEYRINEVKQKIADKNYIDHSILRIAYDSGFNSKSSFNTMFKKITDITPSEYKKKVLS
jgi:AraC-like DNA-binding protein